MRIIVPEYFVGALHLTCGLIRSQLQETEILKVIPSINVVKTDTHGWIEIAAFKELDKGRIGHVKYYKGCFRNKRVVKYLYDALLGF